MRVRALDANGDWLFGKGQNDFKTSSKAVAQNIQTRLLSFLGDCFFDLGAGIDWFTYLGGKDQLGLNLAVSAVILNTDFVISLVQVSVDLNRVTRGISLKYTAVTSFGVVKANIIATVGTTGLILTESGDTLTTESGNPLQQE